MKNIDIVLNQDPIHSRKLLAKEATRVFGFDLHYHIPMNHALEDHFMTVDENFHENLFCCTFSPKVNSKLDILSSCHSINLDYCIQVQNDYEQSLVLLTDKIENALRNNITFMKKEDSSWGLFLNSDHRKKINQHKKLLSELNRLEETHGHHTAVEYIRDDNPILIVKDNDFICNIPDIDFNDIELYSIQLNRLNAINRGSSLLEKTVYKVKQFEIDKNKKNGDIFIRLSFVSTDHNIRVIPARIVFNKDKNIWTINLSNKHKHHKDRKFFFKEDDINKYIEELKTKLFTNDGLFEF